MNIAVFADVHGRVALCFDLCARWQQMTGERIDLILQAGDLGAFPDTSRLDSATLKYAQKDPTELGFTEKFAIRRPEIAALLSETTAPLVFVRGNHEDHAWLDELEQPSPDPVFPVDVYRRVFCLKTGVPYRFERDAEHLTITGIGRVGARTRPGSSRPSHIQDYEVRRIERNLHTEVDILLTHDIAFGYTGDETGMEEIRIFLDSRKPVYHFFGHTGWAYHQDVDANGFTITCKVSDLHWTSRGTLEPESFGLLRWKNREEHTIEVVSEPWLDRYSSYTWKYR